MIAPVRRPKQVWRCKTVKRKPWHGPHVEWEWKGLHALIADPVRPDWVSGGGWEPVNYIGTMFGPRLPKETTLVERRNSLRKIIS